MSDLFGNTAQPRWIGPEERTAILADQGRATAGSFNNAFNSAFDRSNERAYYETKQKELISELEPVAEAFKGADSPEKSLDIIAKNPHWLMNPKTAPFVNNWMNVQAGIAKSQIAAENSKIGLQNQQRVIEYGNALGAMTGGDGEIARSQIDELPNNGWVLDSQGRRVAPSTEALKIMNEWRGKNNLLPFGSKPTQTIKPASTIGKLEADKKAAISAGAPQEVIDAYDKAIKNQTVGKQTAAIADANQIDEWDQKAKEMEASGDKTGAERYKNMADNLRQIKHINNDEEGPKFYTDPQTGTRYVQFPGYAPKEIKDKSEEYEAKAALHDYRNASNAYYKAKSEMGEKKDAKNLSVLSDRLNDLAAASKAVKKFFGKPVNPVPTQPAAQPTQPPAQAPTEQSFNPDRFKITPR